MKKFLSLFLFSLFAFTALAAVSSSPAPDETITILGVPGADDSDGNTRTALYGMTYPLAAYMTVNIDNVDDFVENVTNAAVWQSSNQNAVRLEPNGRKMDLVTVSGGQSTVSCEYEGIKEQFTVNVIGIEDVDLRLFFNDNLYSSANPVIDLEEGETAEINVAVCANGRIVDYAEIINVDTSNSDAVNASFDKESLFISALQGHNETVEVTVTARFGTRTEKVTFSVKIVNCFKGLLDGSDYYIFQMDATTFEELDRAGKVTSDMRTNGAFEGDVLIPEDATRVNYVWNVAAEVADAPQSGVNSFGLVESWFSVAAASPTPEGGWGNICGGLGIGTWEYPASSDAEVAKLQDLTPDHVLVVVLKGNYTPATSLQIAMTPTAGGDNVTLFEVTDATGRHNDGDWEVFTLTYSDLVNLGIDLSQPITAETWYPWAYMANGAGNRVDVDCVFFYIPDEGSTSINETRNSAAMNVTAKDGRVYCDEAFRIVNMAGQDVTSLNGELQGTYLVAVGGETVKINVD